MMILVAYDSRHGATRGIAERIARGLRLAGHHAEARPVLAVGDPADYDAAVIGSACYGSRWLRDSSEFVYRHRKVLARRPVWLFSSGPLGTGPADASGRGPRSAAVPVEIAEFTRELRPRGHEVFSGALDPSRLTLAERWRRSLPGGHAQLPAGDYRNWAQIDAWAACIARELAAAA
jgi:menaquinone-dependent protoporphyrinogen oxidase